MKASEAPEKIYRTTTYLDNDKGKTVWKNAPVAGAENTEYTRTDAFIEKACKYLEPNVKIILCGDKIDTDKFIEQFKKYMEGK